MAYDSSPMGRRDPDLTDPMGQPRMPVTDDRTRFPGGVGLGGETGFRDEPEFRRYPYPAGDAAAAAPAALDDVFDDPVDGEPGQDRLGVHWIWELVLLVGVVALVALTWQADSDALRGQSLSQLLVLAAGLGLLGVAAGLTLRAGAPNLAIGPVAVAAGVYFAERGAEGVAAPTVVAVGAAVVAGAVLAVLVVGFHVPGWAASLAAAAGAVVWLYQQPPEVPLAGAFDPTGDAALLFGLVAAVAIVSALVGTLKPVRRTLGRFRPVGDPAHRRGAAAAVVTSLALVASMVLAVLAGVILAAGAGVPVQGSAGTNWLELTVLGVAVALVGGTSAFGRRGGVFGTVLAVLALVLFHHYQQLQGWGIALLATGAVALVAGLLVTRLVERFGRPRSAMEEDWQAPSSSYAEPSGPAPADAWAGGADSWASSLPAKPVQDHPTTWDDRWGR